jgi:hypothetical protein
MIVPDPAGEPWHRGSALTIINFELAAIMAGREVDHDTLFVPPYLSLAKPVGIGSVG